jgi:hypothetical protein
MSCAGSEKRGPRADVRIAAAASGLIKSVKKIKRLRRKQQRQLRKRKVLAENCARS